MLPWLEQAKRDFGLKEIPGPGNAPGVLALFRDAGHPEIHADVVPWCAGAVAAWLHRAGIWNVKNSPGSLAGVPVAMSLWALAWAKYGQACKVPVYGAIGVKGRKGGGHVGIIVAANATRVWMIGGNQHDEVCVANFPRSDFVAFRYPPGYDVSKAPPLPSVYKGASFLNAKET